MKSDIAVLQSFSGYPVMGGMWDDMILNVSFPLYRVHLLGVEVHERGQLPVHVNPCRTGTDEHFSCVLLVTAILLTEM